MPILHCALTSSVEGWKLFITWEADTIFYFTDGCIDLLIRDGSQPDSQRNVHFPQTSQGEKVVSLTLHAVIFAIHGSFHASSWYSDEKYPCETIYSTTPVLSPYSQFTKQSPKTHVQVWQDFSEILYARLLCWTLKLIVFTYTAFRTWILKYQGLLPWNLNWIFPSCPLTVGQSIALKFNFQRPSPLVAKSRPSV